MKRFFVCLAVFTAMVLMVGCGGNNDSVDDYGKPCEDNVDIYHCKSEFIESTSSPYIVSYHYQCRIGKNKYYQDYYNPGEYFSDFEEDLCNNSLGCDYETGKCIRCEEGQYLCSKAPLSGYIYRCDSNGEWIGNGEMCEYGCAKETSSSILDLCADE